MKRTFLILLCPLLVLAILLLGYNIGKTSSSTEANSQAPAFSSKIVKKQDSQEEQKDNSEIEQQVNISEEKQDNKQQQITAITKEKAIQIVEADYQSDGHIVVMDEDDKSYTIGCFWEMYFDEHTGEPLYNMQAAEYVVDKYSGEILSVIHREKVTTQNNMRNYYYERYWEIESQVENIYDDLYITKDLIAASSNELYEWDTLLNEVYNYIKGTIPPAEFEKLKQSELNWIKERDKNAESVSDFDGSMAGLWESLKKTL